MTDPLLDLVARLPSAAESADRARRTQARCHRVLSRRAPLRVESGPVGWRPWSRAFVGLGARYLAETLRHIVRVYGLR